MTVALPCFALSPDCPMPIIFGGRGGRSGCKSAYDEYEAHWREAEPLVIYYGPFLEKTHSYRYPSFELDTRDKK